MPIAAYANPEPQASQQSISAITGTVLDENGEAVIGASVVEKGNAKNGASTDIDGKFSLKVKPGATIKVSYIGYKTADVAAAPGMTVNLQRADALLDEVVIVGYGSQKKVNLTGAVSTVDVSKQLEGRPQQDLAKALQGAVPGLTITTANGDINATPVMKIRGTGTLSNSATSDPLIVVDGVPMDDISFLNPDDIKDVSVLKDAASASIYGTRAAFGVILITTKSAKKGEKVTVKYNNNFAWSKATVLPEYSSVPNQIRALMQTNNRQGVANELFGMYLDVMLPYAEAWEQQNNGPTGYREMRPFQSWDDVGDYFVNPDGTGAMYYANWDVADIWFQDAAPSQSHNVSLSGSTEKTTYYASFSYGDREGLLKVRPDKLKRYNVNANFSVDVTDWLTAGVRFNFTNKEFDAVNSDRDNYTYLWRWGSYFGPYGFMRDANGEPVDTKTDIAYRKQGGADHDVTTMTRIQGWLKADIIDGLTLNADYTYDLTNRNNEYSRMPVVAWNTWGGNISAPTTQNSTTHATQNNTKIARWTTNVFGSYEKTFAQDHNLKVMAGFTAEEENSRYFYARRMGLVDTSLPILNLANGDQSVTASAWHRATAGFFGRINYDYKGIYLLELNGRYDGSSRFPEADQWAFFPSMSLGYRFSEEKYFEPIRDIVSNGKLRFSLGEIGNEAVGNNMFLSTISSMSAGSVYWLNSGGTKISAYNMPTLVSSALSWERVRTTDIGLDLGFLNNEFQLGFDWYQRDTEDMLAPGEVLPDVVGASAPYINAGSIRTRGWELSLNWKRTFGEFDVYAQFNIADAKTTITKWNNRSNAINQNFTSKTYGDIYGFVTERYFTEDDFVGKNADGSWIYAEGVADQTGLESGNFVYGPGDIKFKDLDGNGVINSGNPQKTNEDPAPGTKDNMGDVKVIGNTTPRYEYSFRLGAAWRGFDIDAYFQGVGKRDAWYTGAFVVPFARGADASYANQESYNKIIYADDNRTVLGYEIDQNNRFPVMYAGSGAVGTQPGLTYGKYNFYPQTRYLQDMSYLRLKNLTIGYTLPSQLTKKFYVEKLRVYVSGDNLALLHNGNSDNPLDPEINTGGSGSSSNMNGSGTFGRTAPITQTYSFGLQVTF